MRIKPSPCKPGESSDSPEIMASAPIAIRNVDIKMRMASGYIHYQEKVSVALLAGAPLLAEESLLQFPYEIN
jgi:hypothetical protein